MTPDEVANNYALFCEVEERADKAEKANRNCVDTAERMRTLAGEEAQKRRKVEAERDWLALQLQRAYNGCPTRAAEKEWWLERAAKEAAKRVEKV